MRVGRGGDRKAHMGIWAGAFELKKLQNAEKVKGDRPTDQMTNRRTNRRTDGRADGWMDGQCRVLSLVARN